MPVGFGKMEMQMWTSFLIQNLSTFRIRKGLFASALRVLIILSGGRTLGKNPSFPFYPADWRKDSALQMCSFSTQGIWINLLCAMWESNKRGKLTGMNGDYCRLIGCSAEEFNRFLSENEAHKFADVTNCDGTVTVINRRMAREERARQQSRESTKRYRDKKCDAVGDAKIKVLPPPSSSSSYPYKNKDIYIAVFDHWNTKEIIIHRNLNEKTKRAILTTLKERTPDEIQGAIDNYAAVLKDPGCYWSHKWTLAEFLRRGLEKFLDEADPLNNFRAKKEADKCLNKEAHSFAAVSELERCGCKKCLAAIEGRI